MASRPESMVFVMELWTSSTLLRPSSLTEERLPRMPCFTPDTISCHYHWGEDTICQHQHSPVRSPQRGLTRSCPAADWPRPVSGPTCPGIGLHIDLHRGLHTGLHSTECRSNLHFACSLSWTPCFPPGAPLSRQRSRFPLSQGRRRSGRCLSKTTLKIQTLSHFKILSLDIQN